MIGLQYYIITHFITGVLSLITGFIVFGKDRKKVLNITYFFLALSISAWSFSYSIWLLQNNAISALFWARTLNLGSSLIPVFYLHWILSLLKVKRKKLLISFYVFTFIFLLFGYSNLFISGTKSILQFPYFPQANWMYIFWLIVGWGGVIIYTFSLLINNIRKSQGNYRLQLIYVLVGSAVGFLGGTTNHFLMLGFSWFQPFGSPLAGLYPLVLGYAMVKHHLMDIKLVMRQYSVNIITLLSVLIPIWLIDVVVISFFPSFPQTWILLLAVIATVTSYTSLKEYYYRLANKYFFSSLYDSREVIAGLSDKLRSTLEIGHIYDFVSESLMNAFHSKTMGILAYSQKKGEYVMLYNKGFDLGGRNRFASDETLHHEFIKNNKPIVLEELKNTVYQTMCQPTIEMLGGLGVELLAPLNLKDTTIGIIALGPKESGDMYNDEDLRILEVVGAQVAIAMENAMLYDKTKKFNITMKKEIAKATEDLREANQKLIKLDEAKSEFISIASHQLRTPLTVIKGYISMILENNFGDLDEKKRAPLEKVFISNERLIQLVENLLNISRIESGRLQFNYTIMNLEDMVNSVVEELMPTAKKKSLKLVWKKPTKPLAKVNIDEEKIRQVVMNLTDNAIKYTKQGTVTVSIKEDGNNIEFSVSDSGMGISPTDLPNLFQKFSRGTGTSLVHTEGTGLGLYVARQMIEAHKGRVWAESKGEGLGSKFVFTVPVKKI